MADSPASDSGRRAEQEKRPAFKFCSECSNILYPKEDAQNSTLMFECRTCRWSTTADTSCIYRNELTNTIGATAGVTQDVAHDPTLPRIEKKCTACGELEAVFFQSQQRTAETGMKLYYVCCTCGNVWQ